MSTASIGWGQAERIGGLFAFWVISIALLALTIPASTDASSTCPDSPIRPTVGGQYPADCLIYEKVSPGDKGKGEVAGGGTAAATLGFRGSPSGDRIIYPSDGHFLGNPGAGLQFYYLATRGETSWRNVSPTAVLPFLMPEDFLVSTMLPSRQEPVELSDDGKMVLGSNQDPETGLIMPNALFLVDAEAGTYERITPPPVAGDASVRAGGRGIAGTADYDTVYFTTDAQLTDDATAPGIAASADKVYRYRDGQTELASYSPSGAPSAGMLVDAATVPGQGRGGLHTVSDDGNVFWFLLPGFGVNRIFRGDANADRSAFVNESENSGTIVPPGPAIFLGASPDGSRAVFSSSQRLVDEVNQGGTGTNLYLYEHSNDPSSDRNLTLISADNEPADGTDVNVTRTLGVSGDARTVYFATPQQLVAGETTAPGTKIYRWHDGTLEFLTIAETETPLSPGASYDGRYMTMRSSSSGITADDNGGLVQLYVYDSETESFACASCRPGATSTAAVPEDNLRYAIDSQPRRWITDDGGVLFLTAESLIPHDTNGKVDLYRWKDGVVQLVSTGRGTHDVLFGDASRDGQTVFFVTDERLSAWDTDTKRDLYAARLGGGLPEPDDRPTQPCGDQCQGLPGLPPMLPGIGSLNFSGDGNLLPGPSPVKASVGVARLRAVSGAAARLRVRVSNAGRIAVRGPLVRPFARSARKAGVYQMRVALRPRARKLLRKRNSVRVSARVSFRAMDGESASKTIRVTFKHPRTNRFIVKKGGR